MSVRVRTMRLWVAPLSSISSSPRSSCSATDDTERTWPVPPQCGHFSVELSSTLERMRWRDISSRPKCEMCPTWMRARGAAGVDVNRDQRLGLVEHDVAAGAKLHHRLEHGVELALDAGARKDR